jgi:putative PIN family toxin of toxin-antitoxin system
MNQKRIFIDTNVFLIYAAYNKLNRLVYGINHNDFVVWANTKLVDEFIANLPKAIRKKDLDLNSILLLFNEIVTEVSTEPLFSKAPDAKDNFLFDLALQHDASFILTEEKGFLSFIESPVPIRNIK